MPGAAASDAAERALGVLERLTVSGVSTGLQERAYSALPAARRRATVAGGLRRQARVCRGRGSELYGRLLDAAADDVDAGGPCWRALAGEFPRRTALPLRFMGAVHRLVLAGEAPELARFYPSAVPEPDPGDPWPAFRSAVADHLDRLPPLLAQQNQTNEVRRAATLLCGFLLVARESGLPLRVLELGASAGLLLRWDRYFYRSGSQSFGDTGSPLRLEDAFAGEIPVLGVPAEVVERRGCDPAPIDAASEGSQLVLRSLVWADQVDRLRLLEGALAVAADTPVEIDRAGGSEWLPGQVRTPRSGAATVVFQSYVQQFYTSIQAARIRATLAAAGARATSEAPLAWMQLEPEGDRTLVLRVRTWPGGVERAVASCTHHGADARWLLS